MKFRLTVLIVFSLCLSDVFADEGIWLLGNLREDKRTNRIMKEPDLQMPVNRIHDSKKPCLADAVISFGGFYSEVVVSEDSLVFTNHHCGFSNIQQHSSVRYSYLKNGFFARSLREELLSPELYVRFLLRMEDVTKCILSTARYAKTGTEHRVAVDSTMNVISMEVSEKDSILTGIIDTYYVGNESQLPVYRDYSDARLVFAPSSSVGEFGQDTDNWMWPRRTGSFSIFRICVNVKDSPVDYSPGGAPYHPEYVASISLDGYKEGFLCMTPGYPGSTGRYLSPYGIEEMTNGISQAMIDVREAKQTIWKREMDCRPDIRIRYAPKYDESPNYWKNNIGTNKAIKHLRVLEKRRMAKAALRSWIQPHPGEKEKLIRLFSSLEPSYSNRHKTNRALAYFGESFINGSELVQFAPEILNFDFEAEEKLVITRMKELLEKYDNLDPPVDKEVFATMLKEHQLKVDKKFLPAIYEEIDTLYNGSTQTYVDSLYVTSNIASPKGLKRSLERDTTYNLIKDLTVSLSLDLIVEYYEMN